MKSKVLLVGGNGFIGSHLSEHLLRAGYGVRVLDPHPELFREKCPDIEYVDGSFANTLLVRDAIEGCEVLVQLAHSTIPASSLIHPEQEVLDSVGTFVNMINCFKTGLIRKVLFFSSGGAVYGNPRQLPITEDFETNPISPYGVAKLMIEKYLHMFSYLYDLKYTVVRPSNAYGPRQNFRGSQGVIPIFLDKILKKETIQIWGDGTAIKDYIFVDDICRAVVSLIETGFENATYNIGTAQGTELKHLIETLGNECGMTPKVEYLPANRYDVHDNVLCANRLCTRTGWKPSVNLESGAKQTLDWLSNVKHGRL
jgi:UDP-glucose 4-epimerase